ncbi:MAG: hypothetical protein J5998_11050 [Clostridia bacterium]|nr:hypothetical protein [Clostridia bacterium]
MKKIAVRAMIVLAVVVALCMFFSGTIRTITTPKVRFTSARQGKFEMVTELTGQVHFKETEEMKLDVPQGASLTVNRVFVKAGEKVEEGDRLFAMAVVDCDKTIASLQSDYDAAEASLRDLVRKNGEVRLTRNEQAWMDAYYAAQEASQSKRDCRVEVQALLALEGLEMPQEGVPDGASDELIAAIEALGEAESASEAADEALDRLNRYAIADSTWTYLTQRREYEEKMASSEESMTKLTLLSREVKEVRAAHAGYVAEVLVEKGGTADASTVLLKLTPDAGAPVIRTDISDVKQSVSAGSVVSVETSRWGRLDTAVIDTGVTAAGSRYADVTITDDIIQANGSLSGMMQGDIKLRLTTRAQEATCLVSPSAVRGSGSDRYVYVAAKETSTFGGTQMKVQKVSVTVLNESASAVSVAEDLTRSQIIYMEDRALSEGDAVMEYGG